MTRYYLFFIFIAMSKFIGKKVGVWVGLETTRWTAITADHWVKWIDNTFVDKVEKKDESGNMGSIVDSIWSYVVKEWAEGNIWGEIYPTTIGYFLMALLGQLTTTGSWPDYSHAFSVLESNTHPSMTIATSNPLNDYNYALAMLESMEISATSGDKVSMTASLKAKKWVSASHTIAYTAERPFIATDAMVYLADTPAGLDGASNICLQSFTLSISKNLEEIDCISSVDPVDFTNTSFVIEWSIELYFDSEAQKTKALNNDYQALRIDLTDSDVDLGGGVNPQLTIDLAKISYTDRSPAYAVDNIVKQTLQFKGHYDGTSAIDVTLVNAKDSY